MESIHQIFEHIRLCSEDKTISIESATNIFNTIIDPKFIRIFSNNKHIIEAIDFYHKILLLEKSANSLNDVKNIIRELFVRNTELTKTQSTIVSQCMQITMNILFQKCLEFSPNEDNSNNPIKELKYIISLIEAEDKIKIEV
jgi:hypothetical protein